MNHASIGISILKATQGDFGKEAEAIAKEWANLAEQRVFLIEALIDTREALRRSGYDGELAVVDAALAKSGAEF